MLQLIKRKKLYIVAAFISMCPAVILLIVFSNGFFKSKHVKLAEGFSTYQDLVEHSQIVVTATVVSKNNEFIYDDMTFAITEIEVKDCVRGKLNGKTVKVLQTKAEEDPYLIKGSDMLLFLSPYTGPIADNVYVINGLYYGQFSIKDNTLYEVQVEKEDMSILKNASLEKVLSDVRNTEYKETTYSINSVEDIEKANEREKELEAQINEN